MMYWQQVQTDEFFFEGGDPYFQLRLGTDAPGGFALCESSERRPVLIRLNTPAYVASLANQPDVHVPEFYTRPNKHLGSTEYCTALVKRKFLQSLKDNDAISRITVLPPPRRELGPAAGSGEQSSSGLGAPGDAPAPGDGLKRGTVVIGIIDYGIAFAHERFRRSREDTRIEYFWVQDGSQGQRVANPAPGVEEGPRGRYEPSEQQASTRDDEADVKALPYGRELSRGDINRLLKGSARSGFVDEDDLYRRAAADLGEPWLRSVSRRAAHGTHVMDLACGYDLDEKDPEEREKKERRPIIAVQLREATTADTSGENLDAYALDAIRYILDRADAIARRNGRPALPVVINFSYGNVAGPHDGTSDLEAAIDELIDAHPCLNVVLPSGNSHLARLHAQFSFDGVAPRDPDKIEADRAASKGSTPYLVNLRWRVLPDDRTPSFLEIWLPPNEDSDDEGPADESLRGPAARGSRISLGIRAPGGAASGLLDETIPGAGLQLLSDGGDVLCEARYRYIGEPTNRGMFLVALQPTRRNEPARSGAAAHPVAPSGTWTVTLVNTGLDEQDVVEAWIQRDDTPHGFPLRGRQSYFDHTCYQRFDHGGQVIVNDSDPDCVIKRAGSMNAIATGVRTIVVGGYVRKVEQVARYSAGGPDGGTYWPRRGPDVVAVSDDSLVHRGILAAGTRSGSVVALSGTSVAAPQITRTRADELAGWEPPLADGKPPSHPSDGRDAIAKLARPPRAHDRGDQPRPGPERVGKGLVEAPKGAARRGRVWARDRPRGT